MINFIVGVVLGAVAAPILMPYLKKAWESFTGMFKK